jgi:hypothetical protein
MVAWNACIFIFGWSRNVGTGISFLQFVSQIYKEKNEKDLFGTIIPYI